MKFGVFYELQLPRPWDDRSEQRIVDETLEQIELADEIGVGYVWEAEHHFLESFRAVLHEDLLPAFALYLIQVRIEVIYRAELLDKLTGSHLAYAGDAFIIV